MVVKRRDVFLINLDPTVGREIQKTRPCLIISPNEMNKYSSTVLIAPMTSKQRNYPTRISCHFQGVDGDIVLDQIRAVDKRRLVKKLGRLKKVTARKVFASLQNMFAD